MKYLKRFNQQLRITRQDKKLSHKDIAELCLVDPVVVETWELDDVSKRRYPSVDNLLDLCFKTGLSLESFVDLPSLNEQHQLDLPGVNLKAEMDLSDSLSQLDAEIERLIPSEDEKELLRRYRRSDPQSKELILQLIAN